MVIGVKKIEWDEYTSKRGIPKDWFDITTDIGAYRIEKKPKVYAVYYHNSLQGYFNDLQSAKDHVQRHFEEVVLSYLV